MGLAMGMNTVEVDEPALAADVERILLDVPADPPAIAPELAGDEAPREPTLEEIQAAAAGYEFGSFLIVSKAADVLVPAWGVTSDERKALSSSLSLALAAWFPDQQLPPKYMALLAVAGSMYAIVDARRDPDTGKLKPRRHAAETNNDSAGASAAPATA
jgi:hypothetical protein